MIKIQEVYILNEKLGDPQVASLKLEKVVDKIKYLNRKLEKFEEFYKNIEKNQTNDIISLTSEARKKRRSLSQSFSDSKSKSFSPWSRKK